MLRLITHQLIIGVKKTLACHASTVLPLADGRVLTAWFGGSHESAPDVGIWLAEKTQSGFSGDIPAGFPALSCLTDCTSIPDSSF